MSDKDDKTRFHRRNNDAGKTDSAKTAAGEEDKTRIAANPKKSARALTPEEKALALAARKRRAQAAVAGKTDDQTRIAPKAGRKPDDQTRVAPPAGRKPDDKTRVAPPAGRQPNHKTQAASPAGRKPDDQTHFAPSGAAVPPDKTRLESSKYREATPSEENTEHVTDANGNRILKNRFVFEEVLGSGGMGIVYKAKDLLKVEAQDRDPYVAIKVLGDEFKRHPEAFIALQRESRKTQRIAHANIVNVYDFDRDGDTVFMTMEYMEGDPLDKLIGQYRAVGLPQDLVWQILEGLCSALSHAHDQHIIHSDFKPGNIFVTGTGTAKVFDFGIARAVAKAEHREESKHDHTVFDAGNLGALTPAYASLEMLEGETPDVRDDVYALGCITYELFTGRHPFNRMHADEAKRQRVKPKRIPKLKKRQWRAIERALAFDRKDRTESVTAFWQEITGKETHTGKLAVAGLLVIGLASGAYYQFAPQEQPQFSEEDFRLEIARDMRIEMTRKALAGHFESAAFTPAWEKNLWEDFQELSELLGESDPWLQEQESTAYNLYLEAIEESLAAGELSKAQTLAENARRYTADTTALQALESKIQEAVAAREEAEKLEQQRQAALSQQRRQAVEKEQVTEKRNAEFDRALANVDEQLQCHSTINMDDVRIAVNKLRSTNQSRYARQEPRITRSLAQCIEQMGAAFPERGKEAKEDAMRLFPRNVTIAGIDIVPRDPCSPSMAGAGARGRGATCSDSAPDVKNSPVMVVIPGTGDIPTFAMGQFEVTVGEINEFCEQSARCEPQASVESNLPAHNISLATANGYLQWLSQKLDRQYRLPTYNEWQHAAHAEGSRVDSNRNCHLNSRGISKGKALIKATIGQKNKWGLVNHFGNAREWVSDRGGRYLAVGGSFETPMNECNLQNSTPHGGDPDSLTGFRVVREVK